MPVPLAKGSTKKGPGKITPPRVCVAFDPETIRELGTVSKCFKQSMAETIRMIIANGIDDYFEENYICSQ